MKIHKNSILFKLPFLSEYDGIVLGRHAFFAKEPNKRILSHEMVHQAQMDRVGVFMFYVIYLKDYVLNLIKYKNHWRAYFNIPFEIEAYSKEDQVDE